MSVDGLHRSGMDRRTKMPRAPLTAEETQRRVAVLANLSASKAGEATSAAPATCEAAVESCLRVVLGAAPAKKADVFRMMAPEALHYASTGGSDVVLVADRLQHAAEQIGLVRDVGQDTVQGWMASPTVKVSADSAPRAIATAEQAAATGLAATDRSRVASLSRLKSWRDAITAASDLQNKAFKPVRYVVPGYIVEGVTVFAGKPKIGKSWFLYELCLATAAGRFVLGTTKPAQGNVLYLALEDSQRRLQNRLKKLWPSQSDWPSELQLTTEWRRADEGGIADLEAWCASVPNPVLIVIDTLEKFRPQVKSNSAAYSADYTAIAGLHKLAHERGIAVVVIHHVRKMDAEDPFDMVSGTNGLTGAADTTIVLKRQAGNTTLYARGRDIEEKETAVRFDRATCRWQLLGDAEVVQGSGERTAIFDALREAGPEGLSVREIMMATARRDRNAVDQLLYRMKKAGEIQRTKRGYYSLPAAPQ